MLKRLYVRFVEWVFGPSISPVINQAPASKADIVEVRDAAGTLRVRLDV